MAKARSGRATLYRAGGATGRLRLGVGAMLALLLVIGGRLVLVQGFGAGGYAQAALDKRLQTTVLPSQRGEIVDASGKLLAQSVIRYNITVDQPKATNFTDYKRRDKDGNETPVTRNQAISDLAGVLGMPVDQVTAAITGDKKFNYVARNVTPDVEARVSDLAFPGIYTQGTSQRVYPQGAVGGNLVGFVGSDGTGLAGIEQTQNAQLSGKDGKRVYEIGADGLRIPVATDQLTPAQNGQTIKLTINSDLQYFTQQAIQTQTDKYSAQWGIAIVQDVTNGNILAMADSNPVDPNDPGKSAAKDRGVRAVTAAYEPGSVEKTLTMSALIQEGKANPLSEYTVPPTVTVDGQTFADAFTHGTEKRTLAGILGYSMNTGTVLAGQALNKQERYDWLTKFGIGQAPDVGLPGEAAGILATPDKWDGRQQNTVLFGQGLTQSTLQTVRAYQAIANNGLLLQPRLIDGYIGADGTEHKSATQPSSQVISKETAQQVKDMLESAVTKGELHPAAIDGYRVGAKTGTSEAPREDGVPGYDGVTSTLIGMAPMENPRFIVSVVIQRPKNDIFGIGNADVFRAVMSQTLHMYNIQPSSGTPAQFPQYAQ
ncbi:penicillin-binding protein 2 [Sinomonas sp. ASV322]|uniref:peptidoglycan D,D-transpeptidase FtsI family protein n=1 Tax=Sinomonas sp. ASV322 TaxID=3041920 RepID=UPI0027DACFB8|nr:penicillin-binding protein 2 [Sinomonas sp. ASV322]MDQ4500800.1 penicillin-binding protein 2 [Sinomonas sp. ASV322]